MTAYSTHQLRHLRLCIGQNIHRQRVRKRMPLERLAAQSGISTARLDAYELGKYEIGLREMLQIACALKINAHDLLA